MPGERRPTARELAFDTLQTIERRAVLADDLLHRALTTHAPDARDRALTHELVYGVLRRRLTLDWRLDHVADRPMARLPLAVQTVLRLGAYQLLYLERVPASAAVNESVGLIKRATSSNWAGFVNAVLRAIVRRPAPSLPDLQVDPTEALAVRYACPQWLVGRWIAEHGVSRAQQLCERTIQIPPLTLRANGLRLDRDALLRQLAQVAGARPTEVSPVGVTIAKRGDVRHLPAFDEGGFYVEDEGAQLVPPLLDPKPGERILDACAAPGGKATHLAALMGNQGVIVALDASERRLRALLENCRRLGVTSVTAVPADATHVDALDREPSLTEPFDRALVDAPCSGIGVLRRHPEAKWRIDEALLRRQQARQLAILSNVRRLLRPGGIIVYSTCSTEPEENEQVLARFCHAYPDWSVETIVPWLPPNGRQLTTAAGHLSTMFAAQPMDGFFAARLRRAG